MADMTATMGLDTAAFRAGLREVERDTDRHAGAVAHSFHKIQHALLEHAGLSRTTTTIVAGLTAGFGPLGFVLSAAAGAVALLTHHQEQLNEQLKTGREAAEHFELTMKKGFGVDERPDFAKELASISEAREAAEKQLNDDFKKAHAVGAMSIGMRDERLNEIREAASAARSRAVEREQERDDAKNEKKQKEAMEAAKRDAEQQARDQQELERGLLHVDQLMEEQDLALRRHETASAELSISEAQMEIDLKRLQGKEDEARLDQLRLDTARKLLEIEGSKVLSEDEKARAKARLTAGEAQLEAAMGAAVAPGRGAGNRTLSAGLSGTVSAGSIFGGSVERPLERNTAAISAHTKTLTDLVQTIMRSVQDLSRRDSGVGRFS